MSKRDRGSVLVLVPAGFLVLILLAAMAVDSAAVYQARQQLHDTLDAAAADAVAAGIGNQTYYEQGSIDVDEARAVTFVCDDVELQAGGDLHGIRLWMAVGDRSVLLKAEATVYAVFGRAFPGFGRRAVRTEAEAVVSSGQGAGPAPGRGSSRIGPFVPLACASP